MKPQDQKMWLLVEAALLRLKQGRYWTTSVDEYNREYLMAIALLEEILRKLEERK